MKSRPTLIEPLSIPDMRIIESFGQVSLFEGQPGESIRHAPNSGSSGQSYFRPSLEDRCRNSCRTEQAIHRCSQAWQMYQSEARQADEKIMNLKWIF
jgi:hypothetical protein